MKPQEIIPYLTKFISVHLDDDTTDSGYIANPADFKGKLDDHMRVRLLNGLFMTEIDVSRIISISLPSREDTAKIPILGYDQPMDPSAFERTEELSVEEQLDRLMEMTLFDLPPLDQLIDDDKE